MGLMRLLGGKADVIKGFAKRCNEQYQVTPRGEIGLYLGDIQGPPLLLPLFTLSQTKLIDYRSRCYHDGQFVPL